MPRRLPVVTLTLGLVAVYLALTRPAHGEDAGAKQVPVEVPAQEFQRVHVDPGGVEGTLQLTAIPLRTDFDTRVMTRTRSGSSAATARARARRACRTRSRG